MTKITASEILNMDHDDLQIYRNWRSVHDSLVEFGNRANMSVFKRLFCDYEIAERLWNMFVGELNRDVFELWDCLTVKQKDELLVNSHINKNYLYS